MKKAKGLSNFIKKTEKLAYKKRALMWFQENIGKIVTSKQLAILPGKDGNPISHNIRRIFELRDEDGYEIVNHNDNETTGFGLKVNEWVLIKKKPNPKRIRSRGVDKRIRFAVFERDNHTCQFCGRTAKDDDPFRPNHKITLHTGHIIAHKRRENNDFLKVEEICEITEDKKLTEDDFITMCNVCNEGAKNRDLKKITLKEKIETMPEEDKKSIYKQLKKHFEDKD